MTAAVIVLAVVVALLGLLVAGLLRSHAEILRALHELGVRVDGTGVAPVEPPIRTAVGVPAPGAGVPPQADVSQISGTTPTGDAAVVAITGTEHQTLLAFLSSGCLTCRNHWDEFRAGDLGLPGFVRLVVVTKDPDHDSPSAIAELAPAGLTVVMSTAAWDVYDVPVSPYFVLVDGPSGRVLGEGAAATWNQVRDLMLQASGDRAAADAIRTRPGAQGRRDQDADDALTAAGINPGDPRLHHEPDPDA